MIDADSSEFEHLKQKLDMIFEEVEQIKKTVPETF